MQFKFVHWLLTNYSLYEQPDLLSFQGTWLSMTLPSPASGIGMACPLPHQKWVAHTNRTFDQIWIQIFGWLITPLIKSGQQTQGPWSMALMCRSPASCIGKAMPPSPSQARTNLTFDSKSSLLTNYPLQSGLAPPRPMGAAMARMRPSSRWPRRWHIFPPSKDTGESFLTNYPPVNFVYPVPVPAHMPRHFSSTGPGPPIPSKSFHTFDSPFALASSPIKTLNYP
jgi:hypothetical protein